MNDELQHVLKQNTTPAIVLAVAYVGGVLLIVGGAWFGWYVWSAGTSFGIPTAVSFFMAGLGFTADANRRLGINRILRKVRTAATRGTE